jgi:hypothetical protein
MQLYPQSNSAALIGGGFGFGGARVGAGGLEAAGAACILGNS